MYVKLSEDQKQANKEKRAAERQQAKDQARINAERSQRPIESITITIDWRKSRMWGSNPHAQAQVKFKESDGMSGSYERENGFTCSGCGYCKESTVIAQIFNKYLKYKLWVLDVEQIKGGHGSRDKGPAPYGISTREYHRYFAGGIGTSCYYEISAYIGGHFEKVASGRSFDVYKYTDQPKTN